MSHLIRKPTMWFLNKSDTNRAVQSQKQARSSKFWIYEKEEVYYPLAKTKALISFAVTAKLICVFRFHICRLFVFSRGGSNVANQ